MDWAAVSRDAIISIRNVVWLAVAAIFAITWMEPTAEKLDNSDLNDPFHPDMAFAFGELFTVFIEVVA
jgi:hypothetical protein